MSCSKSQKSEEGTSQKTEEGKKKPCIKWNQDHTMKVLDIYVNYELMWNTRHSDYANKAKRESAMLKLMVDLTDEGVPVPDIAFLRARIKAIKSTYKSELLKVCESKKSGKGTDDLYVPKLPWFSTADSFMRDVSVTRKSTSNLAIEEPGTPSNTSVVEENFDDDLTELDQDGNDETVQEIPTENTETNFVPPLPKKRRMTKLAKVEHAIAKLQQITDKTRPSSTSSVEIDEMAAFGNHIAAQLRTLPTKNRLTLQDKIQSLITTERLKLIESPQASPLMGYSSSSYGVDSDCDDFSLDGSCVYRNLH